jgi:ATP-dependent DNA helicase HFM1/MER3
MGDQYFLPEDVERPEAPRRHASSYNILQPQFKQPARPAAARDRYRATQYDNPMYDVVEDDVAYSQGTQFDSFGMWLSCLLMKPRSHSVDDRLLQQPYPDRQRQAAQGRARLSFAPGPSTFFRNAALAQSQSSHRARDNGAYDGRGDHITQTRYMGTGQEVEHQPQPEQGLRGQLSELMQNIGRLPC